MNEASEGIAVIGMAARFPGAPDLTEYWRLLVDGREGVGDVPAGRWRLAADHGTSPWSNHRAAQRGGFIDDVDQFDCQCFGISHQEAAATDPQHRLLLELVRGALENAGIPPSSVAGTRGGVYVGISTQDYSYRQYASPNPYSVVGNATSAAANRVSYQFGLGGPSIAANTACSSSLVAVHLAFRGLLDGEAEFAIAAGVNLMIEPSVTGMLAEAKMLAPDGRCKTFDAAADGYVRGEGCGVLVLKRVSDALRDGDAIWAVIQGTAVNQDGRSRNFASPNGDAQVDVIRQALAVAGVEPDDVDFIEAHGTGTRLGDPIEIDALARVFGTNRASPLHVGAVKTNIGHLEAAAGVAGLIKAILAVHHGQIPASLHLAHPNPLLRLDDRQIVIPTRLEEWTVPREIRIAGVSSFGIGGTNAHVIVRSATPPPRVRANRRRHVLAISSRSSAALRRLAGSLAAHLAESNDVDCGDVCFTLNTGRDHAKHRLAVCAASTADLSEKLRLFGRGESVSDVVTGECEQSLPIFIDLADDDAEARTTAVAAAYVAGATIDWAAFHQPWGEAKVHLPPSPLERRSCWMEVAAERPAVIDDDTEATILSILAAAADTTVEIQPHMTLGEIGCDSLAMAKLLFEVEQRFRDLPRAAVHELTAIASRESTTVAGVIAFNRKSRSGTSANQAAAAEHRIEDFPEVCEQRRKLSELGAANPFFRELDGIAGAKIRVNGHVLTNFANYNMIGLSGHPSVSEAAKRAIDEFGTSVSASRPIAGQRRIHRELEEQLADFLGVESALVFVGGHATNETTIGHLFGRQDLILHDELIHNSVIQGCVLSGADRMAFRHNDCDDLESILREARNRYRRVLIVTEGVFSMDGDLPDLPRFVDLRKTHRTLLMIDEAHSFGILGETGRGIGEHFAIERSSVDLWMGTLSKTLASCGGYIAGSRTLVEYLQYAAPGFLFSVGITPQNAAAALAALRVLREDPSRVHRLRERAELFRRLARERGLNTGSSERSAIVPILLGDSARSLGIARELFDLGIHVFPVIYPAVKEGLARLRFFLSSEHSVEDVHETVATLAAVVERHS